LNLLITDNEVVIKNGGYRQNVGYNSRRQWQEVIEKIVQGPALLVFHLDMGLEQFPCPAGFLSYWQCKKNSEG
jgi:hypothetical protein